MLSQKLCHQTVLLVLYRISTNFTKFLYCFKLTCEMFMCVGFTISLLTLSFRFVQILLVCEAMIHKLTNCTLRKSQVVQVQRLNYFWMVLFILVIVVSVSCFLQRQGRNHSFCQRNVSNVRVWYVSNSIIDNEIFLTNFRLCQTLRSLFSWWSH